MDLTKFLWLLQARALYFARADNLEDPYEGHYTEYLVGDDPTVIGRLFGESTGMDNKEMRSLSESYRQNILQQKKTLYVNCWHMNEDESQAMWRLYAPHGGAVSIQSSYANLADALPQKCFLGCIKYVDYRSHPIGVANLLNYITHKRTSFAHERELRAVVWDMDSHADYYVVPIDLNKLITKVYVSPNSDPTIMPIVKNLCAKYELNTQVFQSGVNAPPPF